MPGRDFLKISVPPLTLVPPVYWLTLAKVVVPPVTETEMMYVSSLVYLGVCTVDRKIVCVAQPGIVGVKDSCGCAEAGGGVVCTAHDRIEPGPLNVRIWNPALFALSPSPAPVNP